jgi:hypothetical protein
MKENRFLVDLVRGISHKQLFFSLWFAIVALFVSLMIAYYRKNTRRNFRSPRDGIARRVDVHARRLGSEHFRKEVIIPNQNVTKKE